MSALLQAFGKFIFHSRSRRQFYFLLNPDKIHNELLKLSQNHYQGKPIAVAVCLKGIFFYLSFLRFLFVYFYFNLGNPNCARLILSSNLSTTLTDRKRYDHTHLIEITPPEKGTFYLLLFNYCHFLLALLFSFFLLTFLLF